MSFAHLNRRQQEAVRYVEGPLLVLAGAGSGKTSVITHKIAWLIDQCAIAPRHIVAVTFTNKAAREMKTRIGEMASVQKPRGLTISTFHMLGLNILRQEAATLGYKKGFSIFDSNDSLGLVQELLRKGLTSEKGLAEQVQWQISSWKNALLLPDEVARAGWEQPIQQAAAKVYGDYQRHLKAYNACDFDDLILQPVTLFRQHEMVLHRWQARIQHLLVDEYQDTNACQYALVKLLVGIRGMLTVVGDDDQSVYAWRGAQPENLQQLQHDFPQLKVVKLEQNYRCTGRILKAANALIANNPHVYDKALWSELGFGDPIRVMKARNEEHEAERVVSQILHHKFLHRTEFRDYAILYRGNYQARPFEKVLREHRVPYFLSGGTSFFDRTEVRDIMAYLRLVANPRDDNAFLRIVNTPRREIGPVTLEKLARLAGERGSSLFEAAFAVELDQHLGGRAASLVRRFAHWAEDISAEALESSEPAKVARKLLADIDYPLWLQETSEDEKSVERRMENVLELLSWLEKMGRGEEAKTFADLVGNVTLMGILERDGENSGDCVSLMTLHAAKGLEFPHVFIVGMEEELLPHRGSMEHAIEEERRLAYVGITRAKRTLAFSLARQRKRYGELIECAPSRFLAELPQDDLQWDGAQQDPEEKRTQGEAHLANLRSLLKP